MRIEGGTKLGGRVQEVLGDKHVSLLYLGLVLFLGCILSM